MKKTLRPESIDKLKNLSIRLLDQRESTPLIMPQGDSEGFWFGGGNFIQQEDGTILTCGRYRNHGDARTGTGAGQRGLEFSIFKINQAEETAEKIHSFSKSDLSHDAKVVSIEGGCILPAHQGMGFEMIVSTEKEISYPKELIHFQKPGTGVWSIDLFSGIDGISSISLENPKIIARSEEPNTLHVKDPVAFRIQPDRTELIFCHHSFSWSSSNTGLSQRMKDEDDFILKDYNVLPRGNSWDVACARVTERLAVPKVGEFADLPDLSLYFYDGAECLRSLDENKEAANRPRGYSCEELGGLGWGWDQEFPKIQKISTHFPLFLSPHGTGCSRYVSALNLQDGSILAGWQQSQKDYSQPLVINRLDSKAVESILA